MTYYNSPKRTPRPSSVPSITPKIRTGHDNTAITIGYLKPKKPFEVFTTVSKSDSCEKGYLEALSRSISLGLQYGVPAQEYVDQLEDIECVSGWHEGNQIKSPADAIAFALREFISGKDSN